MSDANINKQFGPFLIQQRLGSGGVAVVYKAQDQRNNQTVALKILHNVWTESSEVAQRFAKEAEIVKHLQHPSIVPVYDYGVIKGRSYLSMRYMARGNLAQRFERPTIINSQEVVRLLRQVGGGLDYAHRRGVVHRDLKLENILLDERGDAALSDFGIARIVGATRVTATGSIIGTPRYMSPEQARGLSELDYRADLYALAVIAYVLTTGRFPFIGSDLLAILSQHLTAIPPRPSELVAELPAGIDVVLLKGLAKRPEDRYSSADAFIEAYARALADEEKPHEILVNLWNVPAEGEPTLADAVTDSALENLLEKVTPDTLYDKAKTTENRDEAIDYLKRALELDPWHMQANRLLHKLEGVKTSTEPKLLSDTTARPLPSFDRKVRRTQAEIRAERKRTWTRIGCVGSVLMSLAAIWFVANVLGFSWAGDMLCLLNDSCPVREIQGTPVEYVPNAVLLVQPDQTRPVAPSQAVSDSLLAGYAHEYTFDARVGEELVIGVMFMSPTAQRVGRNVAIFDPTGTNAELNCERQPILEGDTTIGFDCKISMSGTWKVRIFGREGESTGPYVVSVERF